MKISRRGSQRDRGTTTLVQVAAPMVWPTWDADDRCTVVSVQGDTGHTYTLRLDPSDLAKFVEQTFKGACGDQTGQAAGSAMAAFIRERLRSTTD
jgi:hypothetical protein